MAKVVGDGAGGVNKYPPAEFSQKWVPSTPTSPIQHLAIARSNCSKQLLGKPGFLLSGFKRMLNVVHVVFQQYYSTE